ncbi:MAG: hypothetical protein ACRCYF_09480, partial [Shewanella sp.]
MNSLLNTLNLNRSNAAEAYSLNSKKTDTGKTEPSTDANSSTKEPSKTDTKPSDEIALSPRAVRAQKIQA